MISLHRLGPDDWATWRALRLSALAEAPEAFGAQLASFRGPGDSEWRWRARLCALPVNLAARSGAGWLAMASAGPVHEGVVELSSMWVTPAARGLGLAGRLIAETESWSALQGALRLELRLHASNTRARAIYLRYGFTEAQLIKRRSRGRQDSVLMVRVLAAR